MSLEFVSVLIILVIIVVSVILHELAHGLVAYWLGDRTAKEAGRLSLNPLKHIDPFMSILVPVVLFILNAPVFGGAKPVPINKYNLKWREWGMALVALAGPFTNLLIAFISFVIGHFTGLLYGTGGQVSKFIFSELVFVNLGFTIFNILPIPPLDGSRLLYAISPDPVRSVLSAMETYGIFIVYFLIIVLGQFFSNIMVTSVNGVINAFYFIVGA